ncbi:MAG: tRNA epoxyqueuosine(34) reductase QueG [Ilumatobacteraceae bacterium]
MRPTAPTRHPGDAGDAGVPAGYLGELEVIAGEAGISRTGVAPATVLRRARAELHRRAAAGLADGMQFTYRNPQRSTDPQAAVAGARAVFVGAMSYAAIEPSPPAQPAGRIARYAWADHYGALRAGLWAVAHRLRADGWKAVAYADDNSIVDREAAYLAGIGWFGKNANLLVPGAGSWFVLGCVVTTAPLPLSVAVQPDGCGACHRCIDRCPTAAIIEPGVIDARRCLSWILQKPGVIPVRWRAAIGNRLYGCDDCQDVCPPTVRSGDRQVAVRTDQAWVSLVGLLDGDDDAVVARWGRWYLTERDPRWARRNALVALGNVGEERDPEVRRVLATYIDHHDPVLRVHAIWAARRIGLDVLVPATDADAVVHAELAETVLRR